MAAAKVQSSSKKSPSAPNHVIQLAMFGHLLFLTVLILLLVWLLNFRGGLALKSENKQKIFNMHPLLMVIGFVLLSGEAIMSYKSNSAPRRSQKAVHGTLNFSAFVAGVGGIAAAYKYHKDLWIPHMYTMHSWFGMITICCFFLQFFFGFASFVYPRGESSTRAKFSPWHIMLGLLTFLMAIVTAETGLIEKFVFLGIQQSQESLIINFTGLLIFLFGAVVVFTVVHRHL